MKVKTIFETTETNELGIMNSIASFIEGFEIEIKLKGPEGTRAFTFGTIKNDTTCAVDSNDEKVPSKLDIKKWLDSLEDDDEDEDKEYREKVKAEEEVCRQKMYEAINKVKDETEVELTKKHNKLIEELTAQFKGDIKLKEDAIEKIKGLEGILESAIIESSIEKINSEINDMEGELDDKVDELSGKLKNALISNDDLAGARTRKASSLKAVIDIHALDYLIYLETGKKVDESVELQLDEIKCEQLELIGSEDTETGSDTPITTSLKGLWRLNTLPMDFIGSDFIGNVVLKMNQVNGVRVLPINPSNPEAEPINPSNNEVEPIKTSNSETAETKPPKKDYFSELRLSKSIWEEGEYPETYDEPSYMEKINMFKAQKAEDPDNELIDLKIRVLMHELKMTLQKNALPAKEVVLEDKKTSKAKKKAVAKAKIGTELTMNAEEVEQGVNILNDRIQGILKGRSPDELNEDEKNDIRDAIIKVKIIVEAAKKQIERAKYTLTWDGVDDDAITSYVKLKKLTPEINECIKNKDMEGIEKIKQILREPFGPQYAENVKKIKNNEK